MPDTSELLSNQLKNELLNRLDVKKKKLCSQGSLGVHRFCLSSLVMVIPFMERRTMRKGTDFWGEAGFCFGHVQFEMLRFPQGGDFMKTIGCVSGTQG